MKRENKMTTIESLIYVYKLKDEEHLNKRIKDGSENIIKELHRIIKIENRIYVKNQTVKNVVEGKTVSIYDDEGTAYSLSWTESAIQATNSYRTDNLATAYYNQFIRQNVTIQIYLKEAAITF